MHPPDSPETQCPACGQTFQVPEETAKACVDSYQHAMRSKGGKARWKDVSPEDRSAMVEKSRKTRRDNKHQKFLSRVNSGEISVPQVQV